MMSTTTATATATTNTATKRIIAGSVSAKAPGLGQKSSNKTNSIKGIASTFLPPATRPSPAASAVDAVSLHNQSSSSRIEEVVSGSHRPPSIVVALGSEKFVRREHTWAPAGRTKIDPPDPVSSPPPLLLLEGDKYCMSKDGIARTLYRCDDDDDDIIGGFRSDEGENCTPPISIEEIYDIPNSTKRYVVHNGTSTITTKTLDENSSSSQQHQPNHHPALLIPPVNNTINGYINVGQPKQQQSMKDYDDDDDDDLTIEVKEVLDGILNGVGTGSTTWESSIVMSMIFNAKPQLLQGHVIELGCGVGFGGILMGKTALSTKTKTSTKMKSMTLTDYSLQVLEQCKMNITNFMGKQQRRQQQIPIHVEKLDWYDSMRPSSCCHAQQQPNQNYYDTIIACDCAYRYDDIEALAETMIGLLNHDNPRSQIHIFGPANRGGLHELIKRLRQYKLMMEIKSINMVRYRISPDVEVCVGGGILDTTRQGMDESSSVLLPYETKSDSTYLHVTCVPCDDRQDHRSSNEEISMVELD